MKNFLITAALLFCTLVKGQHSFELKEGIGYTEIPFESVSNLIIVPAIFNGNPTKFILDTGASKTLLFNWNNIDSLQINVKSTLKIDGYGEDEPLDVFYTDDNLIEIGAVLNKEAVAYVLANRIIELEAQLGIFVNGILGADFFKELVVEIDYKNSILKVFRNIDLVEYDLTMYSRFEIIFQFGKPYLAAEIGNNQAVLNNLFLIDSGSSEALWITEPDTNFKRPEKKFKDYLGFGVNGDVFGERSKVEYLQLDKFKFNNIAVSFPFLDQVGNGENINSSGSVGGEILRRFKVVFDFSNNSLYLKKASVFEDGFYFNMAGIQTRAGGLEVFRVIENRTGIQDIQGTYGLVSNQFLIDNLTKHSLEYVPKLYVSYVRPNSPAALAGVKIGDKIEYVDGLKESSLTISSLHNIFYRKANRTIRMKLLRQGQKINVKFRQIPLIE